MLVQSLEKLKNKKLAKRSVIVAGEAGFYNKLPSIIQTLIEKQDKPLVIVLPDLKYYRRFVDSVDPQRFTLFPPLDVLPFEPLGASYSTLRARMKTLLNDGNGSKPIITTALGLLQKTISGQELQQKMFPVHVSEKIGMGVIRDFLKITGYEHVFSVKNPGEFSVKGFIVDFYPLHSEKPLRIEFFDNEIVEIRTFHPETQRMIERHEHCLISPAKELIFDQDNEASFRERIKKLK